MVWISFLIPFFSISAQGTVITTTPCNTPLVGPGRVVDNISDALVSLLGNSAGQLDNLLNGDLTDSVAFNTVSLGATPIVSVKDIERSYAAGLEVGFVVKTEAALNIDLLSNFQLNTYINNVLVETSYPTSSVTQNFGTNEIRISFVTTQPFNEVELATAGLASVGTVSVYYAFVQQPGCGDFECKKSVISGSPVFTGTVTTTETFTATQATVSNSANVTNADTTDHATMNVLSILGGNATITVHPGQTIPGGSAAGFVIDPGLLNVANNVTLITSMNGTMVEAKAGSSLVSLSLGNNLQAINFATTLPYNEINIMLSGVAGSIDVYYAFISFDDDNDGFYNCVDKCPGGNDGIDSDGDGIPDDCDCVLDAGPDFYLCSGIAGYDLGGLNLGTGLTWSLLSAPSGATVDPSTGVISGMGQTGTYSVLVSKSSTCSDTINIIQRDALEFAACNTPIAGSNVIIFDPSNGGCLLCLLNGGSGNANNVIDTDLSNYIESTSLINVANDTPIVGVQDKSVVYPAGTRTGFVISSSGGLLNANLLAGFTVSTYLNGVLQETATAGGTTLLATDVVGGSGAQQRIGFVTTKPFNAVVLSQTSLLNVSLFSALDVYYAFQEPANGCGQTSQSCTNNLLAGNDYKATIEYARSGITGLACVGCGITSLGNLLDNDLTNYANITLVAGVGSTASVSVRTPLTIGANNQVGFVFSSSTGLTDVSLLSGMQITTYLDGVQQQTYTASSLANVGLLGGGNGQSILSFLATMPFNEVSFSVSGLAGVALSIDVYNAFVMQDSDGDGVPDCIDKCCLGNDNIVGDDGLPVACEITVNYDATCRLCPVTVVLGGPGLSPSETYSLNRNGALIGSFVSDSLSFTTDAAGVIQYELVEGTTAPAPVKNVLLNIYPDAATWNVAAATATWKDSANWVSDLDSSKAYPIWCTDVTIPENAAVYPILVAGDECRDITFKNGASVGKIQSLKYRHAFVEYNVQRNMWQMVSAPLRYMFTADYSADTSWEDDMAPEIFISQFDVDYSNGKLNPDGLPGTAFGNFGLPFSNLEVPMNPADGIALWVTGSPYPDISFPTGTPYLFPRRNADTTDVEFDYYYQNGDTLIGGTFSLPRGNDIKNEPVWTQNSTPDLNNRFRFIFEQGMNSADSTLSVPVQGGRTVMVGNPFMSHIDFEQFYIDNQSNVYDYYRIWNANQFYTYLGINGDVPGLSGLTTLPTITGANDTIGQYIAPMQAVFLDTKGTGEINLEFSPRASTAVNNSKLRSAAVEPANVLRLHLKAGEKSSVALIALAPGASNAYNAGEDIYKLFSPMKEVPEIYTIAGETAIEINVTNADAGNIQIPVGVKTTQTGIMNLEITGAENVQSEKEIYLIDREKNKKYDLRAAQPISFEKESADNLEGRFYISFEGVAPVDPNDQPVNNTIQVFINDGSVTVSSSEEITGLRLYDLSGKMIYSRTGSGKYVEKFVAPVQSGVSILTVETVGKIENRKIIF
ncbi:MAG: T9SS type A sorting domain-containing protein [Prevotellaceae bacterium]|nr:T9SS type A sorting domain-containing protein [Prevotellaceae bacterium]